MPIIPLRAQKDLVDRLSRAEWWNGLVELVWNGLDAEATRVDVKVTTGGLLGEESVLSIAVEDNGHGFTKARAERDFGSLGGSDKADAPGRMSLNNLVEMHGSNGQGRLKAFALGDTLAWRSIATDEIDGNQLVTVTIDRSDSANAIVADESVATESGTGTVVTILNPTPKGQLLLHDDVVASKLSELLAIHLLRYPNLQVLVNGVPIDPESAMEHRESYPLEVSEFPKAEIAVDIVEWNQKAEPRVIHLCDSKGMSLGHVSASKMRVPGFHFTAYVRWDEFRSREVDLLLVEDNDLAPVIAAAKLKMLEHFRERARQKRGSAIDGWKQEGSYPYDGEPATEVEKASRELFEVVAVAIDQGTPGFAKADVSTRSVTLRLLREAVDRSPEHLMTILNSVVKLSADQMEAFAGLIEHTPLPRLIAAAQTITDRLVFLDALRDIVFDHTKVVNERDHLHKVLENELWIFGDHFTGALSERGLTKAIKRVLETEGRHDVRISPVTTANGEQGRLDLMLSASILGAGSQRNEHLIVELKRPSVRIGEGEFKQVRDYAKAITNHQEVAGPDNWFDFWLIGNELDMDDLSMFLGKPGEPPGLALQGTNFRIWIMSWHQVIDDVRRRLDYLSKLVEHRPSDERAIEYLHLHHETVLPDEVTRRPEPPEN